MPRAITCRDKYAQSAAGFGLGIATMFRYTRLRITHMQYVETQAQMTAVPPGRITDEE
ncbi:hypothetical protein [Streptomyces sp. NPDC004728]|uniref:hypothetical protein n=1 Tax=Streptomyces sp. NPDC004728 TaxID=3154289 RepID=UPI0033B9573A